MDHFVMLKPHEQLV